MTAASASDGLPVGNITVNPLSELVRLCDVKSDAVNMTVMRDLQLLDRLSDRRVPDFTENSKIFELDSSLDVGHVCLVFCAADDRERAGVGEGVVGVRVFILFVVCRVLLVFGKNETPQVGKINGPRHSKLDVRSMSNSPYWTVFYPSPFSLG